MLYLSQVDSKYLTEKEKIAHMSHDSMQAGVQKILEDAKFDSMYTALGPRQAIQKAAGKNMAPLIEAYQRAPRPVQPAPQNPNPVNQPAVQNQNPVNQPVNQNQNPVLQPHA